jgi:hypothetical protein
MAGRLWEKPRPPQPSFSVFFEGTYGSDQTKFAFLVLLQPVLRARSRSIAAVPAEGCIEKFPLMESGLAAI